jgi:hypothetical protein
LAVITGLTDTFRQRNASSEAYQARRDILTGTDTLAVGAQAGLWRVEMCTLPVLTNILGAGESVIRARQPLKVLVDD